MTSPTADPSATLRTTRFTTEAHRHETLAQRLHATFDSAAFPKDAYGNEGYELSLYFSKLFEREPNPQGVAS